MPHGKYHTVLLFIYMPDFSLIQRALREEVSKNVLKTQNILNIVKNMKLIKITKFFRI